MTDKVIDGDIQVKHIPTDKMWANMNTKPKQGNAFSLDRSKMMNCDINLSDEVGDTHRCINEATPNYGFDEHFPIHDDATQGSTTSMASAHECVGSM